MSGDVSLAADVSFPNPNGYGDRKAVLVIRQNLDDDSKEAMIGEHGTGMIHLAQRPEKGRRINDMQYRFGGGPSRRPPCSRSRSANASASKSTATPSPSSSACEGEPMHQFGPPIMLHFDEPFYVGIGFCSHLPAIVDTGVLSNVTLENAAGKVR